MKYAATTQVSPEKSRAEIEQVLKRYGADGFSYAYQGNRARVEFLYRAMLIRFIIELPDRDKFVRGPRGIRTSKQITDAHQQAIRQRWRALALAVKSKLENTESGLWTFESEFLSHIVNPATNRTISEEIAPQLAAICEGRGAPLLLSAGSE